MSRKAAREISMKLIYQFIIQKEDHEEQFRQAMEEYMLNPEDAEFVRSRVLGTRQAASEIDRQIETYAKGWKLSRMPRLDLAILRLAIFEIEYARDVPTGVAINEAVELAKKFSTEESGTFINGLLGRIAGLNPPAGEESPDHIPGPEGAGN